MLAVKLPFRRPINALTTRLSLKDTSTNKVPLWHWLLHRYDFDRAAQVLEVGAGNGEFWLANLNKISRHLKITGTDMNKNNLDRFAVRLGFHKQFHLKVMDTKHILFPARQFDWILAHNVLHLLKEPLQAIANISHVLKNEGRFAILTPGEHYKKSLYTLADKVIGKHAIGKHAFHHLTPAQPIQQMLEQEFKILNSYSYINSYLVTEANIAVDHIYFTSLQNGLKLPENFYSLLQKAIYKIIDEQGAMKINADMHLLIAGARN